MAGSYTSHHVVSADGTRVAYRTYGDGPALVLLHGGLMGAFLFDRLATALSDAYTVVVPDRRGRGASGPHRDDHDVRAEIDDLRAVLAATGASDVFGLSSGAVISLEAALAGDEIRRLAVFEPPLPMEGQISTWGWAPRYEADLARGDLGAAMATILQGTGDTSILGRVAHVVASRLLGLAIRAQARRPAGDGEIALKDLVPTMRYDVRIVSATEGRLPAYAAIGARTLLLCGSRSPENLKAPVRALSGRIADVELVEIDGVDHVAATNAGRPEDVARELRRFFAHPG